MSVLEEYAQEGLTRKEIAGALGISTGAARARIHRSGVDILRESDLTLFDRVDRIEDPEEAIDYLKGALSAVKESLRESGKYDHLGLTKTEARLMGALDRRRATISRDALFSAMYYDRSIDEQPDLSAVDIFVCKLRKKLPRKFGRIECDRGQGYRFYPTPAPVEGKAYPSLRLSSVQLRIMWALDGKGLVAREDLFEAVYVDRPVSRRPKLDSIRSLIRNLRRNLPKEFGRIETVLGQGYRFIPAGSAS